MNKRFANCLTLTLTNDGPSTFGASKTEPIALPDRPDGIDVRVVIGLGNVLIYAYVEIGMQPSVPAADLLRAAYGDRTATPVCDIFVGRPGKLEILAMVDGVVVPLNTLAGVNIADMCVDKHVGTNALYVGGNDRVTEWPVTMVELDTETGFGRKSAIVSRTLGLEWSAAYDGTVIALLADGTAGICRGDESEFTLLQIPHASKVFVDSKGKFVLKATDGLIFSLDVAASKVDEVLTLADDEDLLRIDEDDTLVITTGNGSGCRFV